MSFGWSTEVLNKTLGRKQNKTELCNHNDGEALQYSALGSKDLQWWRCYERLNSHISIGLIITGLALGQGRWIGVAVLELWEGTDISLEAQTKLQENLIWYFSFLPFPLKVLSEKSLEDCSIYSPLAGQEGSRAIGSTLPKGMFWALLWASWLDASCVFLAFPWQK